MHGHLKGVLPTQEDEYGSMALLISLRPYAWVITSLASPLPAHNKALH